MNTTNARQALESIKKDLPNIKSRIVRYVVPLLGGPEVKKRNQEPGLQFLESISPQQVVDLEVSLLEEHLNTLKQHRFISNAIARNVKSSFHKFRSFLITKKWASDSKSTKTDVHIDFRRKFPKQRLMTHTPKAEYSLGACVGDFINPLLRQQIDDFSSFLLKIRAKTSDVLNEENYRDSIEYDDIRCIWKILGWLTDYKTPEPTANRYPNKSIPRLRTGRVPMEELRLEYIVSFIKLNLAKEGYLNRQDRLDAEDEAYEQATIAAQKMIGNLEEFLDFFSNVPASRGSIIDTCLNVAKFLYQDERKINRESGYDLKYERVPAVEELRKLSTKTRKAIKNSKHVIPKSKKNIPWCSKDVDVPDIYDVLFHLKSLVDAKRRNSYSRKEEGRTIKIPGTKRTTETIAYCCQNFLMFAFLCVIPPARQQFLRELVLEESFVWGQILGEDEVISATEMADPTKARWVFGLRKGKTFNTYGFKPYYLPNTVFPDGTFLYDYVDKWVNEYRQIMQPKTSHLFFRKRAKDKLSRDSVYSIIRNAVEGFTGQSTNPHFFRNVFNSYIENGQVNPQLKTAMRKRQMTQSDKVAEERYVEHDPDKIDAPMNELFQGMINRKGKIAKSRLFDQIPPGVDPDIWEVLSDEQRAAYWGRKRQGTP